MKLKTPIFTALLIIINTFFLQSQITNFKEKYKLPEVVKETSGLLFLDGKIITHNDSGDAANLYELDSVSGNLIRPISITNATHVDWEDIADDETHIYIGDIGNNNGNRTDLKIYRILKTDFKNKTTVSADVIEFSYEDQTNFDSSENHNFDAEAFIIYNNSILIFTKNRGDFKTNVYKTPASIGNHTAIKVSSANVEGLITGATLHNNNILLCGYNSVAIPFIINISSNRNTGDAIFNSGFEKYILTSELEQGSQVEAITSFDNGKFYISREAVNNVFVNNPQKLFEFTYESTKVLSTNKNSVALFSISPNPTTNKIHINSSKNITSVSLFNTLGKEVFRTNSHKETINISHLSKGIYLLRVTFFDKKSVTRKIIKL